jgi:hypothetical protein
MNWKIYEWIVVQFFLEGKIYEWIGRYTTELGFRFFFGIIDVYFIFSIGGLGFWNPKIYEWIGRYTNELEDMRMNWKIYEWIMVQIFFGGEKKRMNWKIYEWIGVHFFLEDIRMNWKIYEWIVVQIFFWNIYEWIGRYKNELGFRFFFRIINIYFIFSIGGLGFWNPNKRNKINIYFFNLFYLFSPELQILINKINKINIYCIYLIYFLRSFKI